MPREQGGAPQATFLPVWEKTSCLNAALGNGLASHIVELDDVHRAAIIHAGAAVMPADQDVPNYIFKVILN